MTLEDDTCQPYKKYKKISYDILNDHLQFFTESVMLAIRFTKTNVPP